MQDNVTMDDSRCRLHFGPGNKNEIQHESYKEHLRIIKTATNNVIVNSPIIMSPKSLPLTTKIAAKIARVNWPLEILGSMTGRATIYTRLQQQEFLQARQALIINQRPLRPTHG